MEYLEEELKSSLNLDLKEINRVIKGMLNGQTNLQLNSWLFPSKSYSEVESSPDVSDSSYTRFLEYLLDRLYLFLNLVSKRMEDIFNADVPPTPRNVLLPKNLTFGRLTQVLWNRMSTINDLLAKSSQQTATASEENSSKKEITTQTEKFSLDKCGSCGLAMACIRDVLNLLHLKHFFRGDIYQITQFGYMRQATDAISGCVKKYSEKLQKMENHQAELASRQKETNLLIKQKTGLIVMQEEKIKELENLLEEEKATVRDALKAKRLLEEELSKKEEAAAKLEEEITTLTKTISDYSKKVEEKALEIIRLEESLKVVSDNLDILSAKNLCSAENVNVLSDQKAGLEKRCENLQRNFDSLQAEMERMRVDFEGVIKRSDRMDQFFDANAEKCSGLMRRVEKLTATCIKPKSDKMVSTENHSTAENKTYDFQVKGEPLDDMNRQIEINMMKIMQLQKQNMSLMETIRKLRRAKGEVTD